ncbi:MAG: amino acid permease C-terminal domain-containing protein, partial [Candidatus Sericytochromatia bacterium]
TPSFATIITGFLVAVPALFMNLTEVTDLTSIGTLFAFVLVCGGVLALETTEEHHKEKFRVPYINGQFIVPILLILSFVGTYFVSQESITSLFSFQFTEQQPTFWSVFREKLPYYMFIIVASILGFLSFIKKFSLIPVLGLLSCFYLMTTLGAANWERFLIWLALGLVIYFAYGNKHSRLAKE